MVDYLVLESVTMKPWYFLDSAYGSDSTGSICEDGPTTALRS